MVSSGPELVSGVGSRVQTLRLLPLLRPPPSPLLVATCRRRARLANSPNRWQRRCHSCVIGLSWACQSRYFHLWPYGPTQVHWASLSSTHLSSEGETWPRGRVLWVVGASPGRPQPVRGTGWVSRIVDQIFLHYTGPTVNLWSYCPQHHNTTIGLSSIAADPWEGCCVLEPVTVWICGFDISRFILKFLCHVSISTSSLCLFSRLCGCLAPSLICSTSLLFDFVQRFCVWSAHFAFVCHGFRSTQWSSNIQLQEEDLYHSLCCAENVKISRIIIPTSLTQRSYPRHYSWHYCSSAKGATRPWHSSSIRIW